MVGERPTREVVASSLIGCAALGRGCWTGRTNSGSPEQGVPGHATAFFLQVSLDDGLNSLASEWGQPMVGKGGVQR